MLYDKKKSVEWINIMRALCMIAVYVVHSQHYYGLVLPCINHYIQPFYVNGFFFISGYLLFGKQLAAPLINEKCKQYILSGGGKILLLNIVFRIMIPSILFSLIDYFPKKIIRGEQVEVSSFLLETVGGATTWFTSALAVAELLILIMLLSRVRTIYFYLLFCLILSALGLYLVDIDYHVLDLERDPWRYICALLALPFIVIGGLYRKYETVISRYLNKYVVLLCAITIYVLFFTFLWGYADVVISVHKINFVGYVTSCLGCILLVEVSKRMRPNKLLVFMGQHTICFYFLSSSLPIAFTYLVNHIFPPLTLGGITIVFFFSLLLAYVITYYVYKYFSFFFDLRLLFKKQI